MKLYTHPDCELHEMPGHPERPDRLRAVMQRLSESGMLDDMNVELAEEISDEMLAMVHPPEYIEAIKAAEPEDGLINVDPDTYMNNGSTRAAKLAAGACIQAVQDVLSGEETRVFCATRPPGHHAELASAMGFCLFNNIAMAAEYALKDERINRVAIVDFDVHHCNGTVDIFKDRPEVMVCSSFQDNYYPNRYLDYTNDHIINLPMAPRTKGNEWRKRVEKEWLPKLEDHRPDLLLISAGFDAHKDDPLAQIEFVEDDYEWITKGLIALAEGQCERRLVSALEGGYDLAALTSCIETYTMQLTTHPHFDNVFQ